MDTIELPAGQTAPGAGLARRGLMGRAGMGVATAAFLAALGPVGAALTSRPARAASGVTDADVLNFALNLEYLEAEFYTRAVTGQGLPSSLTTGTGTRGAVVGGSRVPFADPILAQFATDIMVDEQAHVQFLRSALGSAAVAEPSIDLQNSFTAAAQAAGIIAPGQAFNPFADQNSFFLAAFIFEDVGVTAYHGAATLLTNPDYLSAAAGILAVEAYHGGNVRTVLIQLSGTNPANFFATQAIANLRSKASGELDDVGIVFPQNLFTDIAPTDSNGIAFARTPQQVLNIVTLGNAANHAGGFFPSGLNGTVR